jgi:hypothetical protein
MNAASVTNFKVQRGILAFIKTTDQSYFHMLPYDRNIEKPTIESGHKGTLVVKI